MTKRKGTVGTCASCGHTIYESQPHTDATKKTSGVLRFHADFRDCQDALTREEKRGVRLTLRD